MKMLMFDFRESEKEYFEKHELSDFEIDFIKEPLNEYSYLTENQLNETDVISVFITSNLTEEVIKKFKNLRIITTRSTGYNHIDLKYCTQNNIAVFNVKDYGKKAVAQYTFMLVLALVRKLIPSYLHVQNNLSEYESYGGENLENLSLGIIGCGAIGSSVAKIADFFDMKVFVYSYEKNREISSFVNYCSFEELIKNSDIITLHLPYNSETYHIIDNKAIQQMKKGAIIINTARGELVDLISIYNNLISGQLSGVALDSLECREMAVKETPLNFENSSECLTKALAIRKMLGMSNVIITPHNAYNTKESIDIILSSTFNSIRDFSRGLHTNQLR